MGGRHGYPGHVKANTYDCPNLDINKMAKAGVFNQPCQFEITFPCDSILAANFDGRKLIDLVSRKKCRYGLGQ
jgi:hypothetical protein